MVGATKPVTHVPACASGHISLAGDAAGAKVTPTKLLITRMHAHRTRKLYFIVVVLEISLTSDLDLL